jgi:hypothetical protein
MAADPTPPGPPDDRLGHLEDRIDALEQWREHEMPYSIASVNFGLSVLQREVRDLAAVVTRQGQRQDQMGATLRDLTAAQREQAGVLEAHGRMLERQSRLLEQQGRTLEQQGRTQEQQGRTQEQQGRTLEQQGRTLEQQGRTLDKHTGLLEEIIRRLPPASEG